MSSMSMRGIGIDRNLRWTGFGEESPLVAAKWLRLSCHSRRAGLLLPSLDVHPDYKKPPAQSDLRYGSSGEVREDSGL
jgi:hypothetical protein